MFALIYDTNLVFSIRVVDVWALEFRIKFPCQQLLDDSRFLRNQNQIGSGNYHIVPMVSTLK